VPLLEDRFRVVAPDFIGFGETDSWKDSCELTHDEQANLVRGVLHWAATGPVHVVGHSYGGAVAVRLALECPALVKSLVLIEPVLTPLLRQVGDTALFAAERNLAQEFIADAEAGENVSAWSRFIDHHNGDGTWVTLSDKARDRFLGMTKETADAYRSNLNNPTTLCDLQGLEMPALLACGSETSEPFRRIHGILGDNLPDCELMEVEGAGHMSPLTHADEIAEAIRGHIDLQHPYARLAQRFEARRAA